MAIAKLATRLGNASLAATFTQRAQWIQKEYLKVMSLPRPLPLLLRLLLRLLLLIFSLRSCCGTTRLSSSVCTRRTSRATASTTAPTAAEAAAALAAATRTSRGVRSHGRATRCGSLHSTIIYETHAIMCADLCFLLLSDGQRPRAARPRPPLLLQHRAAVQERRQQVRGNSYLRVVCTPFDCLR